MEFEPRTRVDAARLHAAAGRLLGLVNSTLRKASEITADALGDPEDISLTGVPQRLEAELEWLGVADTFADVLREVSWISELRRALTSESLLAVPTGADDNELTVRPYWPMVPGATSGPSGIPADGLEYLEETVGALSQGLDGVRGAVEQVRTSVGTAPEVAPSPCTPDASEQAEMLPLWDQEPGGPSRPPTRGPADLTAESVAQAMDELVREGLHYRDTLAFKDLIRFVSRFRQYSPFNSMLVHLQMPEAVYVARASVWNREYGRRLRPGARPLVMLQPGGPTMPVYDISDTVAGPHSRVPELVARPFQATVDATPAQWDRLVDNAKLWGIRVTPARMGSPLAGRCRNPTRLR